MNITKVVDQVYRGPSPETEDDYKALLKLGVKYLLDLQTGAQWFGDGSPLEEAWNADWHGIRCYAHPLSGITPPTKIQLEDACKFIRHYQPVYVHCKQGVDRTGMVIAWFRMDNHDWTKLQAVNEMIAMGFHWFRYFWWVWFL